MNDGSQPTLIQSLSDQLEKKKQKNLYRSLRIVESHDHGLSTIDGQQLLNFSHNDYLGLGRNPLVIEAAQTAVAQLGTGSEASRLVAGNLKIHEQLESKLSNFKGFSSALVFPTGYQASLGVLSSLVASGDTLYLDRYAHACLVEGAQLSAGRMKIFPHNNVERLASLLERDRTGGRKWIVVDGVYSMDGDIAPLPELLELCKKHHGILVVDDAHATGTIGKTGRGTCEHFGINPKEHEQHLIVLATLSKAVGSQGGAVLSHPVIREALINNAKAFVYTTALSPANAGAALKALEIIESTPSIVVTLQQRVQKAIHLLRGAGLDLLNSETPILPIIIGEAEKALQASKILRDRGILALPIRPPTVPKGTSRIRFAVNLTSSGEEFESTLQVILSSFSAL